MIALREKESLVRGSQVKRAVNVCVSCMFGEVLMKHVDAVLQVLPSVILKSFFSHFLGWLKKKVSGQGSRCRGSGPLSAQAVTKGS